MNDLYVSASYPGSLSMTTRSDLMIYTRPATVDVAPSVTPIPLGTSRAIIDASVCDGTGMDPSGMTVSMLVGDGMQTETTIEVDDSGGATFTVWTSNLTGVIGGFIPVLLWTDGQGQDSGALRMMIPVKNDIPRITIWQPYDGQVLSTYSVTVRGYVSDASGLSSVVLILDGAMVTALPLDYGQESVYLDEILDISAGSHVLKVVATDIGGVSSEDSVTFTMVPPTVTVVRVSGPSSGVAWDFMAATDGAWSLVIQNSGLRAVTITVYDIGPEDVVFVTEERILLSGPDTDPSVPVYSSPVWMSAGHSYLITATPMGSVGSYAVLETQFSAL
jgi:hypothetical protein